jgi:hypothetical protein
MVRFNMLKTPSAFLPILMSTAAFAVVLLFLAMHGPAPQPDEGAAAHLWQLLMALQVPVILFFTLKWASRFPREAAPILALQLAAALLALAPVYLLGW